MTYISRQEGENTTEYSLHGHIFGYSLNDIYIQTHRRGNQTYLHRSDYYYPKPNGVKSQSHNQREENRHSEKRHSQRIHNTTERQIEEQDNGENDIAVNR